MASCLAYAVVMHEVLQRRPVPSTPQRQANDWEPQPVADTGHCHQQSARQRAAAVLLCTCPKATPFACTWDGLGDLPCLRTEWEGGTPGAGLEGDAEELTCTWSWPQRHPGCQLPSSAPPQRVVCASQVARPAEGLLQTLRGCLHQPFVGRDADYHPSGATLCTVLPHPSCCLIFLLRGCNMVVVMVVWKRWLLGGNVAKIGPTEVHICATRGCHVCEVCNMCNVYLCLCVMMRLFGTWLGGCYKKSDTHMYTHTQHVETQQAMMHMCA
jgi:hypothetical protein